MHNVIIEQERDDERLHYQGWQFWGELVEPQPGESTYEEFLHIHTELRDRHIHDRLQADLIEHQWALADHEE